MASYTQRKLRRLSMITKFQEGDPSGCFTGLGLCKHTHSWESHTLQRLQRWAKYPHNPIKEENDFTGEQHLGNKGTWVARMIMFYVNSLWGEGRFCEYDFSTDVLRLPLYTGWNSLCYCYVQSCSLLWYIIKKTKHIYAQCCKQI